MQLTLLGVLLLAIALVQASESNSTACSSFSDCDLQLVCDAQTHHCVACTANNTCPFPFVCDESMGLCNYKPLFPMTGREAGASVVVGLVNIFAGAAGIGGGTVFVPLLLFIGDIPTAFAVPMSMILVFGAAIASVALLVFLKNPYLEGKPIIAYDIVVVMEPALLAGTSLGVWMNIVFPPFLINLLLLVVLILIIIQTTLYGIRACKNQLACCGAKKKEQATSAPKAPSHKNVFMRILGRIRRRFPIHKIFVPTASWILVFLCSLFKGSKLQKSIIGVENCSATYWGIFSIPYPTMFFVAYAAVIGVKFIQYRKAQFYTKNASDPTNEFQMKPASQSTVSNDEMKPELVLGSGLTHSTSLEALAPTVEPASIPVKPIEKRQSSSYMPTSWCLLLFTPILLFLVGVVVALLGTGSGTFLSPLFVMMELPPEIASATSSFMMIFSSLSISVQYLIANRLPYDYALWFFGIGLVSAIIGQVVVRTLVKKLNASWILLWIMVILLSLSFALLIPQSVLLGISSHASFTFTSPCSH